MTGEFRKELKKEKTKRTCLCLKVVGIFVANYTGLGVALGL